MRILLVEPPPVSRFGNQRIFGGNGSNKSDFRKPPLDLLMISGYLRKCGFDNDFIDANNTRKDHEFIKKKIVELKPDVIIISTSTCTIYSDVLVAANAKEINPSIVTIGVGTHLMAIPIDTMHESPGLDIVVYSSEWEQACLNVIENIQDLNNAKGIYYRDLNNRILKTQPQPFIQDMDSLGLPAHDKLDQSIYKDPITKRPPKTLVQGQRACTNSCSFCCQPAFFGAPSVRRRSVDNFVEELSWIRKLGFGEVMFNDATLTSDINWATHLFEEMIRKDVGLVWNCSTRATCLNSEIARLMKEAGCHTVMIGMESSDEKIIKNIRKNVTAEEVRTAVNIVKKAGMDALVFAVIGFPGETKDSVFETISFLKSLNTTYITLGIAVPVPGTDFYREMESKGYLLTKDWSLYDPMKKPVFSYPWLSADDMVYYSAYGLKQFYLRPQYILKRLLSIRSFAEAKTYFINFIGFARRYILPKKIYHDHRK
ncbi:MAG: radical SAM protein [Candidatus Brocadiaceae bacterium]|nr:radical SAM protein [Candidatus Brocadiaceae bacterium]